MGFFIKVCKVFPFITWQLSRLTVRQTAGSVRDTEWTNWTVQQVMEEIIIINLRGSAESFLRSILQTRGFYPEGHPLWGLVTICKWYFETIKAQPRKELSSHSLHRISDQNQEEVRTLCRHRAATSNWPHCYSPQPGPPPQHCRYWHCLQSASRWCTQGLQEI